MSVPLFGMFLCLFQLEEVSSFLVTLLRLRPAAPLLRYIQCQSKSKSESFFFLFFSDWFARLLVAFKSNSVSLLKDCLFSLRKCGEDKQSNFHEDRCESKWVVPPPTG